MEDKKYYCFNEILKFIDIPHDFERAKEYPFTRGVDNVSFSWGQIIIPKQGIRETILSKLKLSKLEDSKDCPLKKIVMLYQVPFKVEWKHGGDIGVINQNISLSFRYDKEWKYGDINKNIYETCFYILDHAKESNDFFIITDEWIQEFFSYYIIDNQYGLGAKYISSPCVAKLELNSDSDEEDDGAIKE